MMILMMIRCEQMKEYFVNKYLTKLLPVYIYNHFVCEYKNSIQSNNFSLQRIWSYVTDVINDTSNTVLM